MKNLSKKLVLMLLSFTLLFSISISNIAFAYVNGPNSTQIQNSTKEEAYLLQENMLSDSLSGYVKRVSNCFLTNSDDTSWFKVYLTTGTKTLTINSTPNIIAKVTSESGDLIFRGTYGPTTSKQAKLAITQAGFYYIEVTANEVFDTKKDFTIMIGAPDYKRAYYTKNLNTNLSLTTTIKTSSTVNFDLSTDSLIPSSAVVAQISLNGVETNSYNVSGKVRSIKTYFGNWMDKSGITFFDIDVLNVNSPMVLKQQWSFKHSASTVYGPYSLNPSIKFTYLCEDVY